MSVSDLISVVIPTRNRRQRLERAIDSVRSQENVHLEIIVADDGSIDDTQDYLRTLLDCEPRLRVLRNDSPLGGAGARNAGAAVATGRYIAFLDDDDLFLPGKLERQLELLRANPQSPAASSSFLIRYEGSDDETAVLLRPPKDRQELLRSNVLGGASVCMVVADTFRKVGGFDQRLRSCQDWDLWLKLDSQGPIQVCSVPLVRYSFHQDGQITGDSKAEYQGKRRVHCRYSHEMSSMTRRHSICELSFYRSVAFPRTSVARGRGLLHVALMARGADRPRYLWRAFKIWRVHASERSAGRWPK